MKLPSLQHHQITNNGQAAHVVTGDNEDAPAIVFLHGWPEDWSAFKQVMLMASENCRVVAVDLPGIGASTPLASGKKRTIARFIHAVVNALGLHDITLVGHDIGGQVAYAYLRLYPDELARVVIMDVVIPGLEPWDEVLRNPAIWHFAFHNVPKLPEKLVMGKQADYFDFFFDAIAAKPAAITATARQHYAQVYEDETALHAGFEWYRAFAEDAQANSTDQRSIRTPVLCLRGDHESGDVQQYIQGLRSVGLADVSHAIIENCGHFAAEEQPKATWRAIAAFIRDH